MQPFSWMRRCFYCAGLVALALLSGSNSFAKTIEAEPNNKADEAQALDADRTLIGSFDNKRDLDFLTFDIHGLRLWRLQAVGEGVTGITLFDPGGTKVVSASPSGRIARLSNLSLPPGRYTVQIKGKSGRYLFRVIDQGPAPDAGSEATAAAPDPDAGPKVNEIEPNGTKGQAVAVAFGERRTGLLDLGRDSDLYRITLYGQKRIAIEFETTDKAYKVQISRSWGPNTTGLVRLTIPAKDKNPDPLVWQAGLDGGDYLLKVYGSQPTVEPYAFTVSRLPSLVPIADLEPNNLSIAPASFPPDGVFRGSLIGNSDLYRMPVRAAETTYTLVHRKPEDQPQAIGVRLFSDPDPSGDDTWRTTSLRRLRTVKSDGPGRWSLTVPAGAQSVVEFRGSTGVYELAILDYPVPPKLQIEASLSLDADTVAAFLRRTQTVTGLLTLRNAGDMTRDLNLRAHVDHNRWSIELDRSVVTLAPGEAAKVGVTVAITPDAPDQFRGHVEIAAFFDGSDSPVAHAEAALVSDPDAAAVSPGAIWTLPEAMLGGLNVAGLALGGNTIEKRKNLIDGLAVPARAVTLSAGKVVKYDLMVDLAGDMPVPLAGVILRHNQAGSPPETLLKDFRIETSTDGTLFESALTGQMAPQSDPQHFAFDAQVAATHVRLVPLSNREPGERGGSVSIGEMQVIAATGVVLDSERNLDLAVPARGGHIVYYSNPNHVVDDLLTTDKNGPFLRPADKEWREPPSIVIGFRDGRAAMVNTLRLHEAVKSKTKARPVRVEYSMDGPLGPWQGLPVPWVLTPDAGVSELQFAAPIWVRYLKLTIVPDDPREVIALPDRLEVLEREISADYRSALGEWTELGAEGVYEWLHPTPAPAVVSDAGDTPETAAALALNSATTGTVELGIDEDWYRLDIPEPGGDVVIALTDRPSISALAEVKGADGESIAVEFHRASPQRLEATAWLAAGRYFVRVHEPPRSMVITWDTSGSVSSYLNQIQNGVRLFAQDLEPGRDEVNFLPFSQSPALLLTKWTGDRQRAASALVSYDRNLNSSNAELSMLAASDALAERDGVHAILVVTDQQSNGAKLNSKLWRSFGKSYPMVFAVGVPTAPNRRTPRRILETFRDWSVIGGGYVDYLTSQSRMSLAFRRAAAWLRRPAAYRIEVTFSPAPPEPASLQVEAGPNSLAGARAVEIILDGSGSMLKRLDGVRRYRIARDALLTLTDKVLPDDVPFALRIFGEGGEGSCRTDLEMPLAPLDRAAVRKAVKSFKPINLAKTPIGASLAAAAGDLEEAGRDTVIVLLTDGEETCDGDPGAEIKRLKSLGFDIQVNIVGFALDDQELKDQFRDWAQAGGGAYFDADSPEALNQALDAAIRTGFVVLRGGQVVATGHVNGSALDLPPGAYTIALGTGPSARRWNIFLKNGGSHVLTLD